MCRPKGSLPHLRFYIWKVRSWLAKRLPQRKRWRNQKVSDAELLALHLARIHFKHPYASVWWSLMRQLYPHLPSYTQAYVRLLRLRGALSGLACRQRRHRLVLVDSQPLAVCRWRRTKQCACAGAAEGYGTHGSVYGFKLHAFVSCRGEVLAYRLRPANQHDYRVAKGMLEHLELGSPLKVGDKAYTSKEFITPPKKNAKRPDNRWKPEYHRLRKRVETVFAQLAQAHIRNSQVSTFIALEARVALTLLAHNLNLWLNP